MTLNCGICVNELKSTSTHLVCNGSCNKKFYYKCAGIDVGLQNYFAKVPGLSWKCSDCISKMPSIDLDKLDLYLEQKFDSFISSFHQTFADLKKDLLCSSSSAQPVADSNKKSMPSYSEMIKNKCRSAVIIEPKNNKDAASADTKNVVAASINPVDMGLKISTVKNTKKGAF